MFPLYDAGSIGMQMRKIWGVMLDPDFDPRAIADSRPIRFQKSMEGVGTLGSETDFGGRSAASARPKRRAALRLPPDEPGEA